MLIEIDRNTKVQAIIASITDEAGRKSVMVGLTLLIALRLTLLAGMDPPAMMVIFLG